MSSWGLFKILYGKVRVTGTIVSQRKMQETLYLMRQDRPWNFVPGGNCNMSLAAAGLAPNFVGEKSGVYLAARFMWREFVPFFLSPVREKKQEQTLFKDLRRRKKFNFFKKITKLTCEVNSSIEMKRREKSGLLLDPIPKWIYEAKA